MTTLAPGQASAPETPDTPVTLLDDAHRATRLRRWRASWRVALRMARRDVRRHRGRSILILVMVMLPVALLVGAATFGATEQQSEADLVPARMGRGQALLEGPEPQVVAHTPERNVSSSGPDDATPIPGFDPAADAAANEAALGRLVGGTVARSQDVDARLVLDDRRVSVQGLVLDGRIGDLRPKLGLVTGRWPTSADEVLVTTAGIAKGLPATGTARISTEGEERGVTVVGTATALNSWGGMPHFVTPRWPGTSGGKGFSVYGPAGWIVLRDKPVDWAEVRSLNRYGLSVLSAAVLRDPPPSSELPPEVQVQSTFYDDTARQIAVLGGVMLFIITTLLVGPAFAVSASRQRRTLALAASNGAETRQLRRSVLAQALVLGAAAAVAGTALGVSGTWAAIKVWALRHPEWPTALRPLDIPWQALGLILPCAVVSALVAALLPALRLGRLDIIGVMRGQSVSPRLNRFAPAAGLLLAVGGALYLVSTVRSGGREFQVAFGAIALVLGTLLTVPALLVLAGRLAAPLPVAARMATRDSARHRSRSTPTVAAILAGVAALTTFSIALASDTEQRRQEYTPQTLKGEAVVGTWDADSRRAVDSILPAASQGLITVPLHVVRDPEDWQLSGAPPSPGQPPPPTRVVAALPPGCGLDTTMGTSPTPECNLLGSQAYNRGQIAALPVAEIARRLQLTEAQRRVIAGGGIAVALPQLKDVKSLVIATGTFQGNPETGEQTPMGESGRTSLEVVTVPASTLSDGAMPQEAGALVGLETARRLGWPLTQQAVLLRDPDGSIDRATETRLDERLGDAYGSYVERGFTRDDEVPMRILFGVAATLLLVVTLIATALSMAEQQADMTTFAAVGATRRTRRALAAAQAIVVGLIGAVLGVAVGLVPGVAVTYPLTALRWDPVTGQQAAADPTLVIPWLPLVLVVVGVPLVAGLLAGGAIRKAPAVTRRGS